MDTDAHGFLTQRRKEAGRKSGFNPDFIAKNGDQKPRNALCLFTPRIGFEYAFFDILCQILGHELLKSAAPFHIEVATSFTKHFRSASTNFPKIFESTELSEHRPCWVRQIVFSGGFGCNAPIKPIVLHVILGRKVAFLAVRLRSAALNQSMQMTHTQNIRKTGFTLVELMIVVAIIGLLAAIAIPNFVKARATSQANACINNLRQIDAAANEWALDTRQTTGATCWLFRNLSSYLSGMPNIATGNYVCPAGGNYIDPVIIGNNPACSLGNTVTPAHILP